MGKIKILPDDLVNKIAAGEVVERPASVVKELLDNAYDSGADQITIDIEDGGMKKIQVTDNGSGMSKEDAEIAFKPHATSKITTQEDLVNIKSFGFRGEALSSISSVSKLTLKTREVSANLGTEIKIEGGNVVSSAEVGAHIGTSVLVEDLFFNVPARKEFVKSTQSEYKAILDAIEAHAIANPTVALTLNNNGKNVYAFQKDHKIEDRVREIFGNDVLEKMIALFFEHPHLEIYGYVGKPELASERKKNQFIFVNKRCINNKSIAFAVKKAFGSLIAKDAYPSYIVFIDITPGSVDVNVHPRKEEVKFSDEGFIFDSVSAAVKSALDRTDLTPGSANKMQSPWDSPYGGGMGMPQFGAPGGAAGGFGTPTSAFNSPFSKPPSAVPSAFSPKPFSPAKATDPFAPKTDIKAGTESKDLDAKLPGAKPKANLNDPFASPFAKPQSTFNSPYQSPFNDPYWDDPYNQTELGSMGSISNGKVMQVHNLYIVTESESGIYIYDQHAVHERVIYEQLIKGHTEGENNIQPLLTPLVINLSVQENETLKEYLNELTKTGFKIEEFGNNSYKITEVPAIFVDKDLKAIIREVIDDLESDNKIKEVDSKSNKMLTYLSCRTAYKAGDSLPVEEVSALIQQLDETDTKYTCPHGRPVKVEISLKELSKMFKRT